MTFHFYQCRRCHKNPCVFVTTKEEAPLECPIVANEPEWKPMSPFKFLGEMSRARASLKPATASTRH